MCGLGLGSALALLWHARGVGSLAFGAAPESPPVDGKPYVYHIPEWPEAGLCSERRSSKPSALKFAAALGGVVGTCRDAGYRKPAGTYEYNVPVARIPLTFHVSQK